MYHLLCTVSPYLFKGIVRNALLQVMRALEAGTIDVPFIVSNMAQEAGVSSARLLTCIPCISIRCQYWITPTVTKP